MRSLVTTSLAAAVAAAGLASGWHPSVQATSSLKLEQSAQFATTFHVSNASAKNFNGSKVYIVTFQEPSLMERHQARQSRSAAPEPFNARSAETQSELRMLQNIQSQHVSAIRAAGLKHLPTHYYLASRNGIAITVESQAELDALNSLSFVKSVEEDTVEYIQTHRSATFVGADKIWDGSAVPGNQATRGQGMVVAVLDTGVDPLRPSFSNDTACGFSDDTPKLLSVLDCSSTDASGMCNGPDPVDNNGHGTHVAGTAAGNVVTQAQDPTLNPSVGDEISGIAPCAQIRSYKVCATDRCAGSDIAAGMESVLLHGDADVMNFSISGGNAPWNRYDGDRRKLDLVDAGVFVVAAAGNTGPSIANPVGAVNHLGPWVMSVASSTHDQQEPFLVGSAGPASANPPAITQNMSLNPGSTTPPHSGGTLALKVPETANTEGCNAHPEDFFAGKAALIHRGSCNFTLKIQHAYDAGAELVIIRNNQASPISMNTANAPAVPSYSIEQAEGDALAQFVADNPTVAEISLIDAFPEGDVLSGFSLRGPTSGAYANLTKPDIAAPGDNVYAPVPNSYAWYGGTSMASPQVAGAGALIRKIHPSWSPLEVKSALMMTAKTTGQKDGVNGNPNTGNWDADDVGNGRMDLTRAAKAGLVMNETTARMLAADPAGSSSNFNYVDMQDLNLPSMRNSNCSPTCTWKRTVRNTLGEASNWTVEAEGFDSNKMNLSVSPASFSFNGSTDETQELTITAAPVGDQTAAVVFGQITLKEANGKSPDLHMTTAIKGEVVASPSIDVQPGIIAVTTPPTSSAPLHRNLRISNFGAAALDWEIVTSGSTVAELALAEYAPNSGFISVSMYAQGSQSGSKVAADFDVVENTSLKYIEVYGFDFSQNVLPTATAINWAIYPDVDGVPSGHFASTPPHVGSAWHFSTTATGTGVSINTQGNVITLGLDLAAAGQNVDLPPGKYWLTSYVTLPGMFQPPIAPSWLWHLTTPAAGSGMAYVSTDNPQWRISPEDRDPAFKITYDANLQCHADWLTVNPVSSGNIAGGEHTTLNLTINPFNLPDGMYKTAICIRSNHDGNQGHMTYIPVTMQVGVPETDLAISATSAPQDVVAGQDVNIMISVANHGPNAAEDVKVELEWSNGLSFISTADRDPLLSKRSESGLDFALPKSGPWSCEDQGGSVTCSHSGSLLGMAQPLVVRMGTDPDLDYGTYYTQATVRSSSLDTDPDNNVALVSINVAKRNIFSDGFEATVIDSGEVSLVLEDGDADKDLNLMTGAFDDYGSVPGADINFYSLSSGLMAYPFADVIPGQGIVTTEAGGTQVAMLQSGDTIGPDSHFTGSGSENMSAWHTGTTAYIGLRFLNEATGQINYGYIEFETSAPLGTPATIKRYVYDNSGAAITIP